MGWSVEPLGCREPAPGALTLYGCICVLPSPELLQLYNSPSLTQESFNLCSPGLSHFSLLPNMTEMSQILHLAAALGQKPLDVTSGQFWE